MTDELLSQLPALRTLRVGLAHLFIQHTSASLTINENADPTVRSDFERWTRETIPDGARSFAHDTEGDDDMPAHIKASLFGAGVTIPIPVTTTRRCMVNDPMGRVPRRFRSGRGGD